MVVNLVILREIAGRGRSKGKGLNRKRLLKRFSGEKGHPNPSTESVKAAVLSSTLLCPGLGPQ